MKRGVAALCVIAALVAHNDWWLWNDARRVLSLPVGLLYHVLYCLAAVGFLWWLQRFLWSEIVPADVDDTERTTGSSTGDAP